MSKYSGSKTKRSTGSYSPIEDGDDVPKLDPKRVLEMAKRHQLAKQSPATKTWEELAQERMNKAIDELARQLLH